MFYLFRNTRHNDSANKSSLKKMLNANKFYDLIEMTIEFGNQMNGLPHSDSLKNEIIYPGEVLGLSGLVNHGHWDYFVPSLLTKKSVLTAKWSS